MLTLNSWLKDTNRPNLTCLVRLKSDNGFVGLIDIDKHHDGVEYEVSYQFIPNYWGKGLAQETVKAAIEYGLFTSASPCVTVRYIFGVALQLELSEV